jgi:PAS domain S-box-containing protein
MLAQPPATESVELSQDILIGFCHASADASGSARMHDLLPRFDWASTSAGPIAQWADPIKHAVRLVLLAVPAMAVLIGNDGIVAHNDAMRILFGTRYDDALGKPIAEVFPESAPFYRAAIDQCFKGLGSKFLDEPIRVHRDGEWSTAWFHFAFTPIVDGDGEVSGVFVAVSETTSRVLALRDLELSQERFEIALDAGGIIGTWDLDIATNRLTCDERFALLFGISAEERRAGINNDAFIGRVHLGDRALVRDSLAETIRAGVDYKCRYRVVMADDKTRWYFGAGRAVRDETGVVVKLHGVAIDLTSQIAAEDALVDSEKRFHALIESIPQIVWSADAQAHHDYFNSRWNEFTGLDAANVDGAMWETLVHPEDWPRVSKEWDECIATGKPYDIEYRFLHHSGQHRWLRAMALPVRDSNGVVQRWYGTSTDIEESKALEMERELVANELDHRIRNLFALVRSLVALSAREDAAFAPFARQFERRLSALHKAHEFIRTRDPALAGATSVQALARAILAPYNHNGHLTMEGDDAALQDHLVTPLALIFHELATNSAKYGALACDGGSLSLRFQCDGGQIMLTWIEARIVASGAAADGGGFGSKLLVQTIERQLKGKFSRTLTPDGLSFKMEIPA